MAEVKIDTNKLQRSWEIEDSELVSLEHILDSLAKKKRGFVETLDTTDNRNLLKG